MRGVRPEIVMDSNLITSKCGGYDRILTHIRVTDVDSDVTRQRETGNGKTAPNCLILAIVYTSSAHNVAIPD